MKKTIAMVIVLAMAVLTLSACVHKHTFTEATCTAPSTCEKCGETEGEPLGHTTEIGQCSRCSENQGLEIVMEISGKLENIHKTSDRAVSKLNPTDGTNVDAVYRTLNSVANIYNSCSSDYTSAIQKCGDYKELATLKKYLQTAKSDLPISAPGYSEYSMRSYLQSCGTYVLSVENAEVELIYIQDCLMMRVAIKLLHGCWIYKHYCSGTGSLITLRKQRCKTVSLKNDSRCQQ